MALDIVVLMIVCGALLMPSPIDDFEREVVDTRSSKSLCVYTGMSNEDYEDHSDVHSKVA